MTLGWAFNLILKRFSSASSDEKRPPEGAHVASATEEVHFHYQSPRGRPTLLLLPIETVANWAPLLVYNAITNHHGVAPNTYLWTPPHPYIPSYYQAPRGRHKYTLFGHPLSSTHFSPTNLHGRPLFGHPSSLHTTNLHDRTLFGHPITYTQLWSLYAFHQFV